ncbi:MAG TPA: HAD-IIIA family hydrolase [Actinopolymorphaceae bacterium]
MLRGILFDRDGTLIRDVPYNSDPNRVDPFPTARAALDEVRRRGLAVGVVSNQSGIGRGLITIEQVEAVADRVEELLGPFDVWVDCPHTPSEVCRCRKPAPGGILAACAALGLSPLDVAYIGDIGTDVQAARAAGALPVLVPTPLTRLEEVDSAPHLATNLWEAVHLVFKLEERRSDPVVAPRRPEPLPLG